MIQDIKKTYFHIRLECFLNTLDFDLNELTNALDLIIEEMSSDEFNYRFMRQDESTLVLTSYLKPEKRKRMSQFLKICDRNLPMSMIYKHQVNALDQNTFENEVSRIKSDPNWKIIFEPTGILKSYVGDDLKYFDDFNNFFPWQKKIYSLLLDSEKNVKVADNRKIISIIDSEGKKGKSSFIKFLCFINPIEIYKLSYGLSGQLRSAVINAGPRKCYIIDLPRTKGSNDKIEDLLSVIEEIKNGFVTSPMYGKSSVLMMEPPFVMVFSNQPLPYQMLSRDRWECYQLSGSDKPDLERINIQTIKFKKLLKKV